MAANRNSEHFEFWQMLKVGYDHFELTKRPPRVNVCGGEYVFNRILEEEGDKFEARVKCPPTTMPQSLELAYTSYTKKYEKDYTEALSEVLKDEKKSRKKAAKVALIAAAPQRPTAPALQSPRALTAPVSPRRLRPRPRRAPTRSRPQPCRHPPRRRNPSRRKPGGKSGTVGDIHPSMTEPEIYDLRGPEMSAAGPQDSQAHEGPASRHPAVGGNHRPAGNRRHPRISARSSATRWSTRRALRAGTGS